MHKLVASLMMALTGAVFFITFVYQDIRGSIDVSASDLPWGLITRYALAMTLGGALAGLLFCGLFGRAGISGWLLALCGGLFAAALSGLFGSAFGLLPDLLADGFSTSDIVQVLAGLLVVPLSIVEQPYLILVLAGLVALTHILTKRERRKM